MTEKSQHAQDKRNAKVTASAVVDLEIKVAFAQLCAETNHTKCTTMLQVDKASSGQKKPRQGTPPTGPGEIRISQNSLKELCDLKRSQKFIGAHF